MRFGVFSDCSYTEGGTPPDLRGSCTLSCCLAGLNYRSCFSCSFSVLLRGGCGTGARGRDFCQYLLSASLRRNQGVVIEVFADGKLGP